MYKDLNFLLIFLIKFIKILLHFSPYIGLFSETNAIADAFAAVKIAEEKFLTVSKSKILLLKLQLLHEHALHR